MKTIFPENYKLWKSKTYNATSILTMKKIEAAFFQYKNNGKRLRLIKGGKNEKA